jgi:deoxyribonuclease-4
MFGSHLSIAGSISNALLEAESLNMDTVQIFTKNQQQWKVAPLSKETIDDWSGHLKRLGWQGRIVAHASYLINLASPNDELWEKSIDLMRVELERCEAHAISFLVHHPGSPTGSGTDLGLKRIAAAYKRLFKDTKGFKTISCLENTVGAGSTLGRSFQELAQMRELIVEATGSPARIAFCFDTCHAHAAGYDIADRAAADRVLDAFDATCGLKNLRVVHMNDSKAPMGSKRDLHEHLGEGTIGKHAKGKLANTGFAAVANHPDLASVPMILETPKGNNKSGTPYDTLNLQALRKLRPSQ